MITRRHYMRDITAARQAYRWELERELANVAAKERQLDAILDTLYRVRVDKHVVPAGGYYGPRIILDVREMIGELPEDAKWLYDRLAQRIIEALAGVRNDYRPDMREADKPALYMRHG